jgi:hypothetical protein
MNCYDYMHLLRCENLQEDVWRVVVLLLVTIWVFAAVGWVMFRIVKRFSRKDHGN